ncbi:30S ribosomal protein S5 [Candidatus Parcubacteria bacterium]|nr:30S ribosomal protein S5 [Candidatus Parcubacteria bacterium]
MAEDQNKKQTNKVEETENSNNKIANVSNPEVKTEPQPKPQAKKKMFQGNKKGGFKGKAGRDQDDFDQRIVDIARVTRVMAGGKRMRFRACVAIGDKKGKVAIGLAKGADVTIAVTKAVNEAKKKFIKAPIVDDTIPHEIFQKFGAAKILFKPARKGRGIIAGGAVRIVLELSGIKNITSKILGTNNKVSNAKCTIEALRNLKKVEAKKKVENKIEDIKKDK